MKMWTRGFIGYVVILFLYVQIYMCRSKKKYFFIFKKIHRCDQDADYYANLIGLNQQLRSVLSA